MTPIYALNLNYIAVSIIPIEEDLYRYTAAWKRLDEEAFLSSFLYGLKTVVYLEFKVDFLEVILDGEDTAVKPAGYLFVGEAVAD